MDVKNKTIKLAKAYEGIANARSILDSLEDLISRFASGKSIPMVDAVNQCLRLKKEQERILINLVESGLNAQEGRAGQKSYALKL